MKYRPFYRKLLSSPVSIWLVWVLGFYVVWAVLIMTQGMWASVVQNWEIAAAMLLGSYAAGSTPMGGGTVGFPVLVMFMDMPAELGRDFSFAIQAIGMTSASILIFCRYQRVDVKILNGSLLGAAAGTPLGIYFIAPHIDAIAIKLVFATLWAGFGVLHVIRLKEISGASSFLRPMEDIKFRVGLIASFISTATICSVTGVGVDMVIYCVLILLFRSDLKIAIPTSVVIMAFTSVIGVVVKLGLGGFDEDVINKWMAAAPVVILGAPLGVLVVDFMGRDKTLFIVALLCIGQYVWTCIREYSTVGPLGLMISLFFVVIVIFSLELLRSQGRSLAFKYTKKTILS